MDTPPKKKATSVHTTPVKHGASSSPLGPKGTPVNQHFPIKAAPGKEFPRGIRPLLKGISLTPIRKRRTKISLSPVKTPKEVSNRKHSSSVEFSTPTQITTDKSARSAVIDVPTSSLDFEEFSFRGPSGWLDYDNVTAEQHKALQQYLVDTFDIVSIQYSFPFIVLECAGNVPAEDHRPFTIAGAIAIWQSENDGFFRPVFGEDAGGDFIEIDDKIAAMMKPLAPPSQEAVDFLGFKLVPDCIGLSIIYDTIVIELPKMDHEGFLERLQTLPRGIRKNPFQLRYWNGALPNSERRGRVVKPQPEDGSAQVTDETDYVKLDNKFYPGTMIQTQPFLAPGENEKNVLRVNQVTAGILIEKNGEKRLTCSYHNWEPLIEENGDLFGQSTSDAKEKFQVFQGDPGSDVGFLRERMGETDVALAQLHSDVIFDNKFMEIDAEAKKLVRSTDCKMNEEVIIDSFAVGKQRLKCLGWRFIKRIGSRGDFYHEKGKPLETNQEPQLNQTYISLEQGVYATTAKVMRKMPHIRDSVCGSVLLKAEAVGPGRVNTNVIHEGGICGMLHYADLQLKNTERAEYFLCYADVFDTLIGDGWTVVRTQ